MIIKVISGGQSGVDKIGLEVAKALGIKTGGTAPMNFWTENGAEPELGKEFGLVEGPAGYMTRTRRNVLDSDATLLFGDMSSAGSKMTIGFLDSYKKPYLTNPNYVEVIGFIENGPYHVINIAGNRASKLTENQMKEITAILEVSFITINNL
jgi:hypothetical protein